MLRLLSRIGNGSIYKLECILVVVVFLKEIRFVLFSFVSQVESLWRNR